MYGYIYITTNLINNKIYIGKHVANQYEPEKYIGSGKVLLRAIKKYGKDNFKNELLCECGSEEELNTQERYYIQCYNSTNPKIGYNISDGGEKTNIGTIIITNDIEERFILPEYLHYWELKGFHVGRNKNTYINGMQGHKQSEYQKQVVSKACSYKRTTDQKANFSKAKKVPNRFICLRTPDNRSTIRCLITNKDKYLKLGYTLCNNNS